MRNLIAIPALFLALILQSAVISRIYLLSGIADLPMVILAAWALQENVDSGWHWAAALGLLVGFVSAVPWYVPVISYLAVVGLAQMLQRRVWRHRTARADDTEVVGSWAAQPVPGKRPTPVGRMSAQVGNSS